MEFPLAFGLQKTGLTLILTSGKQKSLCFLIYIGSITAPFLTLYMNTSKMSLLDSTRRIMGIERALQETPVIEATFNFEGTDYTSTFSVFNGSDAITQVQEETGMQIHGILSTDFLVRNK